MSRLRGAVIGCGMIAEFHLRGWARIPEVEIVALADPDRTRAAARRAAFAPRARTYADLPALLAAEALEFVDIVAPPELHRAQCLLGRDAGLHVICQKPLCAELAEARALVAAFAGYPRLFCVHENHVFRPWFRHILALHRAGTFGELRSVRLVQHDPQSPREAFKREAPRGVLLEHGVHLIDQARTLLGVPLRVRAQLARCHPEVHGESVALVTLDYPTAIATIDLAWNQGGALHGEARVVGTAGEAHYRGDMKREGAAHFRVTAGDRVLVDEPRSPAADYAEAFFLFERAFADAMLGRGPAPQPATENLLTLELCAAAYAAATPNRDPLCAEAVAGPLDLANGLLR